ncbi:MAG: DUF3048 domain-containing protein [Candidatus Gottesmanbacteria bacterium]
MKKQNLLISGIIAIALYLISTGVSAAVFNAVGTKTTGGKTTLKVDSTGKPQKHFTIDPSIPRTESCPLNGMMYTAQEKAVWEKRRPLAVMIENHAESRPQSGLSFADVVYESVAEGGISRFMGVFYCGIAAENVSLAPVRSARTYYLPWVLEYDALYNHVGGAGRCEDETVDERAKALCQIDLWNIKDMDQFGISFPTCYRNYDRLDHTVATEHTMVCQTDKLTELAATRGWTNVDSKGVSWDKKFKSWKFKDDAKEGERGDATNISFVAWKGYEKDYGVKWIYNKTENVYMRENGGVPHLDLETEEQLQAKTVIVLFAKETGPVDDHMHLLYGNIGSGNGLLFVDGKASKITWEKLDRSARTIFFDESKKEISFNKGQIWIEMLPIGTSVTY